MMRYATAYLTTLANTSTQDFAISTIDDYRLRHIKYLYVGISVSGVRVGIYVKGQLFAEIDTTRFTAAAPLVPVEVDVPPQIQMHIGVTDLAGSARTSIPVVIAYEPEGLP